MRGGVIGILPGQGLRSNDETSSESISFLNMEVAMRMMSCRLSANCLNADRVLAVLASSALSGLTESLTLYGSASAMVFRSVRFNQDACSKALIT